MSDSLAVYLIRSHVARRVERYVEPTTAHGNSFGFEAQVREVDCATLAALHIGYVQACGAGWYAVGKVCVVAKNEATLRYGYLPCGD